jgi:hypothetical protein
MSQKINKCDSFPYMNCFIGINLYTHENHCCCLPLFAKAFEVYINDDKIGKWNFNSQNDIKMSGDTDVSYKYDETGKYTLLDIEFLIANYVPLDIFTYFYSLKEIIDAKAASDIKKQIIDKYGEIKITFKFEYYDDIDITGDFEKSLNFLGITVYFRKTTYYAMFGICGLYLLDRKVMFGHTSTHNILKYNDTKCKITCDYNDSNWADPEKMPQFSNIYEKYKQNDGDAIKEFALSLIHQNRWYHDTENVKVEGLFNCCT